MSCSVTPGTPPTAWRASRITASHPAQMCTGSNSASARTNCAQTLGIGSNLPGQVSALCGQASHVAACGSHSAGQRYPSDAGVGGILDGGSRGGSVDIAFQQVAVGV